MEVTNNAQGPMLKAGINLLMNTIKASIGEFNACRILVEKDTRDVIVDYDRGNGFEDPPHPLGVSYTHAMKIVKMLGAKSKRYDIVTVTFSKETNEITTDLYRDKEIFERITYS